MCTLCVCRSENNLLERVQACHHVCPRDRTQDWRQVSACRVMSPAPTLLLSFLAEDQSPAISRCGRGGRSKLTISQSVPDSRPDRALSNSSGGDSRLPNAGLCGSPSAPRLHPLCACAPSWPRGVTGVPPRLRPLTGPPRPCGGCIPSVSSILGRENSAGASLPCASRIFFQHQL